MSAYSRVILSLAVICSPALIVPGFIVLRGTAEPWLLLVALMTVVAGLVIGMSAVCPNCRYPAIKGEYSLSLPHRHCIRCGFDLKRRDAQSGWRQ